MRHLLLQGSGSDPRWRANDAPHTPNRYKSFLSSCNSRLELRIFRACSCPIQGRPSPLRPWCISPLFPILPSVFENFSDSEGNFHNFTFSRKISWFSSAEISDDLFLVIDHKFWISPIFSLFLYIFPLFRENYYFPVPWEIFPLFSTNSPAFYTLYVYFVFPLLWPWCIYASPNARTYTPLSSSPLLLRSAPYTARILCRNSTSKRHRQLWVKDLPKVPTWWLERKSNSRLSVESYRLNQCATTSHKILKFLHYSWD